MTPLYHYGTYVSRNSFTYVPSPALWTTWLCHRGHLAATYADAKPHERVMSQAWAHTHTHTHTHTHVQIHTHAHARTRPHTHNHSHTHTHTHTQVAGTCVDAEDDRVSDMICINGSIKETLFRTRPIKKTYYKRSALYEKMPIQQKLVKSDQQRRSTTLKQSPTTCEKRPIK